MSNESRLTISVLFLALSVATLIVLYYQTNVRLNDFMETQVQINDTVIKVLTGAEAEALEE